MVKLEQNYRSTSAILQAANNVIGPNPKLFPKTLFSELGAGEPLRVIDADNEEHEAERTGVAVADHQHDGALEVRIAEHRLGHEQSTDGGAHGP